MPLQPFTPDADYCVYCHAVAAGPCAACGAICCGDCVELVMGLTQQRAVCRSCLQKGEQLPEQNLWKWVGRFALLLIGAAAIGAWIWR